MAGCGRGERGMSQLCLWFLVSRSNTEVAPFAVRRDVDRARLEKVESSGFDILMGSLCLTCRVIPGQGHRCSAEV